MKEQPIKRVILEEATHGPHPWRVSYGSKVEFTGKRVVCKRVARALCLREGLCSWWNRKSNGELIEVPLGKDRALPANTNRDQKLTQHHMSIIFGLIMAAMTAAGIKSAHDCFRNL